MSPQFAFILATSVLCSFLSSVKAQDFDGLVRLPAELQGKAIKLQLNSGAAVEGMIEEVVSSRGNSKDVIAVAVKVGTRSRKFKLDTIAKMWVDSRPFTASTHVPTGKTFLVDQEAAWAIADQRLGSISRSRRQVLSVDEFETRSKLNFEYAVQAERTLDTKGVRLYQSDSFHLLTDVPSQQSRGLISAIERFTPALQTLFGYAETENPLPGKPLIAAFVDRTTLGKFQTLVVGNKDYGDDKAFFHIIDGNVVITANDNQSVNHLLWQIAWALTGAYDHHSFSDVALPSWFAVGLRQHGADLLVPKLSNYQHERKLMVGELEGATLNGLLDAESLPGLRQLVGKGLVAHLYKLSPIGLRQMISMLKLGRTQEESLDSTYALTPEQFAQSFGRDLGLRNLSL